MFEDALLDSSPRQAGLRRIRYLAMPLAYLFELMFIGVLLLIPLIYTQALPKQLLGGEIHLSPPPGPPPVTPGGPPARPAPRPELDKLTVPVGIPPSVVRIVEAPEPPQVGPGPAGRFIVGAVPRPLAGDGFMIGSVPWGKEPPPPPPLRPERKPSVPRMVRISRGVIAARGLYQPHPVYPPLAIMARIQGTVVLQAIIGTDGAVNNLKVLSGPPLLVAAAIDAVKNWRYQPTLLNEEPVEVLTDIDVNFKLGE